MTKIPKWIIDILSLSAIVSLIVIFAVLPYFSRKAELDTLKNQCKFTLIMRTFVATAADTRLLLSRQTTVSPKVRKINLQAAKVYSRVERELKALPPRIKC